MTYDEFLRYFSGIYVCKYMDNYNIISKDLFYDSSNYDHFSAFSINLDKNVNRIFFTVAKPINLVFCQKEGEIKTNSIYSSIWIGKYNENKKFNYIKHVEGFDSFLTIEMDSLSKGEYVILIHIDNMSILGNNKGSLQIYTQEENIIIDKLEDYNNDMLFSDLCHYYYKHYNKNFNHKKFLTDDFLIYSDSFSFPHSSYSIIIFENLKKNERILMDVLIEINSDLGLESILLKEKSLNYTKLTLNCGENLIIPFYKAGFTYKFSYRTFTHFNRDELQKETRKSGQILNIIVNNREMFYYLYKHKTGMVFRFLNIEDTNSFLNIKFKVTQINNLVCKEEINRNNFDIFIQPQEEIFRFYDVIDINEGFLMNWIVSAKY